MLFRSYTCKVTHVRTRAHFSLQYQAAAGRRCVSPSPIWLKPANVDALLHRRGAAKEKQPGGVANVQPKACGTSRAPFQIAETASPRRKLATEAPKLQAAIRSVCISSQHSAAAKPRPATHTHTHTHTLLRNPLATSPCNFSVCCLCDSSQVVTQALGQQPCDTNCRQLL